MRDNIIGPQNEPVQVYNPYAFANHNASQASIAPAIKLYKDSPSKNTKTFTKEASKTETVLPKIHKITEERGHPKFINKVPSPNFCSKFKISNKKDL